LGPPCTERRKEHGEPRAPEAWGRAWAEQAERPGARPNRRPAAAGRIVVQVARAAGLI